MRTSRRLQKNKLHSSRSERRQCLLCLPDARSLALHTTCTAPVEYCSSRRFFRPSLLTALGLPPLYVQQRRHFPYALQAQGNTEFRREAFRRLRGLSNPGALHGRVPALFEEDSIPSHAARRVGSILGPALASCRSCAHAAALYEAHERCVSKGFAQGGRHDHLNCIRVTLERLDGHRGARILKVGPKRGRKTVQSPRKPRWVYWSWKRARVRRIPVLAMNHINEARHRNTRCCIASVRMLSVNEEGNALSVDDGLEAGIRWIHGAAVARTCKLVPRLYTPAPSNSGSAFLAVSLRES